MQVFFSNADPVSEARALIEALSAWLVEQPEQPLRASKASFRYGSDGGLRTVNVLLDEVVE